MHTDPDSLQHTIASQLVHDEWGLHLAGLLVGVGHKATHKVGLAGVEGGHQLNQRNQVDGGDSLAATLLLLLAVILGCSSWLSRVVFPQENQKCISRLAFHDFDDRVVDGVLVLLEPSSDVVRHNAGVVGDGKVGVLISLLLGLQEDRELAQGGLEFFLERLICRLGEQRLLLKDGPDTHRLLKHDDGGGQVHAEVNHDPVNSLAHIFFLFDDKHVVVEELLELLVDKVDGDLLEAVVLEDLKASNVKHSAEVGFLHSGINEGIIALLNQPLEDAIKDCPGNTTNSVGGLLTGLTLGHPLSADLDPGLAEGLDHLEGIDLEDACRLARVAVRPNVLALSLVITSLGLELYSSAGHDSGSQGVAVILLLLAKAQNVEGVLSVLQLFVVIDGLHLSLSLGDIDVVIDVVAGVTLGTKASIADTISVWLQKLVEDMVGPLNLLLLSNTGLLEQVGHDVTTAKLSARREMDTDELSEPGGVVVPRSLGIAVRLQNGVGGHDLVLKGDLLLRLLTAACGHHGQVRDHLLGVLRLSGTRLASDQHGVVLLVLQHVAIGSLSDGPEVRRDLVSPLADVDLINPVGVDGISLVWVDDNHKQARVGMDHLGLVAGLQIPEDGGVVEEGQVDHVLAFLKLGWVDPANLGDGIS